MHHLPAASSSATASGPQQPRYAHAAIETAQRFIRERVFTPTCLVFDAYRSLADFEVRCSASQRLYSSQQTRYTCLLPVMKAKHEQQALMRVLTISAAKVRAMFHAQALAVLYAVTRHNTMRGGSK